MKPYISQAVCVAAFPQDNQIRYQVREVESAFQLLHLSQAKTHNVTDDMPAMLPRFILEGGPKQVMISQQSAQITLEFDDNTKLLEDSFEIVEKKTLLFWKGLINLKKAEELKNLGVILTINCPVTASEKEIANVIFERFSKFPKLGEVASSSMQFGFLEQSLKLFRNIAIGPYVIRHGDVESKNGFVSMGSIEIEKLKIKEIGIQVKMDVNTLPFTQIGSNLSEKTFELVLAQLKKLAFEDGREFITWAV